VGEKLFTLAGNSLVDSKENRRKMRVKNLYDRLIMRNLKRDCTDITPEAMAEHYRAMMKYRPAGIRGYASSLYFLARYIEQNQLPVCPVKVVFTTGEKLHPKYRDKIQQVFKAPVFDAYGASDGGLTAHECAMHEGLHLGEEHCVVEIVDREGRPLPDGEIGQVLSTDLNNYAFPFLRYQLGDLAYIKKERCSCGRSHRLLGEVVGREGRAIYNKQGRPYSSIVIDNMMFRNLDIHSEESQRLYEKMDRFQIRQDSNGDLRILIKPVDAGEPLSTFEYIKDNFQTYFPESRVELLFVEEIPPLPSGKEDYCVSEYTAF
jgi:phenylacetate-CoA ligase